MAELKISNSEKSAMVQDLLIGFDQPETVLSHKRKAMARGEILDECIQVPRFLIVKGWSLFFDTEVVRIIPVEEGETENPKRQDTFEFGFNGMQEIGSRQEANAAISGAAEAKPLTIDHKIATLLIPEIV